MIATSIKWTRHNLFGKPFDIVLSLFVIPGVLWLAYSTADWAFQSAKWDIIVQSLRVLMIGVFPADQAWRAWTAAAIIGAILGAGFGCVFSFKPHHCLVLLLVPVALLLIDGGFGNALPATGIVAVATLAWSLTSYVPLSRKVLPAVAFTGFILIVAVMAPPGVGLWGGLLLSVLLTLVTSVLSLPIGILLAFGRQSRLSSLRIICTWYIEVMRSVPLILVVYWIWILMPVLAPQWGLADVARGMIGFTIFYSAYVAEYVRSGLQAVPRAQTEAARSLGMSEFDINRSIVLPQALRVVVAPLVGNVLDIFNSAPLVFIIGLTDFLRAGQMILANPQYGDRTFEVLSFLLLTYFLIGSMITYAARKLEDHMALGSR
ncbi:general L-amino acid transport system permease protein [Rhizobium leguminosarum]|uniref:General L-amino acid transport system permease protein n=1 Tax=Rhizobium leguminosarum TaxID=384 RepID=A0AAE2MJY2_RHILE|nr:MULTISPECIES: amino acid ABC transporter permease [Rhizobium]MBB4290344.1 general L-amino acid transport system permease protein [Rhizobium leguminosarum]MBB4296987.1 general L-amino acid transport system permease protein [Rhizobium leguminosarum]MBB4307751.1 general L-amino acid transport system permease protein [Rhizobium leguminosarum]MBB4415587.1 general L-amino acid transport system permease protein [Rhizobium leguminosarum]MBB4431447.1 general L-amino acid transport system permease pr